MRNKHNSPRITFILTVLTFLMTACGGGDDTPPPSPGSVNGCTFANATDNRGQANVTVTATSSWTQGHNVCMIVDLGTTVTWGGNFTSHPLIGGVTPTRDNSSPITIAGPGSGTTPVAVTLSSVGDFGYFCDIHTSTMKGMIYVR